MKIAGLQLGNGVLVGVGAVLLAPVVIPALAGILRPVAKAAIKGSLITYNKFKETTAEVIESIEDLAAEAKAEVNVAAEAAAAAEVEEAAPKAAKKAAKA